MCLGKIYRTLCVCVCVRVWCVCVCMHTYTTHEPACIVCSFASTSQLTL